MIRQRTFDSHSTRRGAGRGGLLVAFAVLGAVAFFGIRGSKKTVEPELTLEERYALDERIGPLMQDCLEFGRAFDVDTSDLIPLLVGKLDAGAQQEPYVRAKQDLAKVGAEAGEHLLRLFDDASRDLYRTAVALNVLETCALAEEPWGIDVARRGIVAARGDVRIRASYVFRNHGGPEDYELVRDAYRIAGTPEGREKFAVALKACDPGRFHYDAVGWLNELRDADTGFAPSSLGDTLARESADCLDPAVAEMMYEGSEGLAPRQRSYLIAPAAATGHAEALEELRGYLNHELIGPRQHATLALAAAGLVDEVLPVLLNDPDARMRGVAANAVIAAERTEARTEAIRNATRDKDEDVRTAALAALASSGDEAAFAETLRLLAGNLADRSRAVRILRTDEGSLDGFPPNAAKRAREVLLREWERVRGDDGKSAELVGILQALGSIPGRETAEFLLDKAVEFDGTLIKSVSGHLWIVGQAYNAGPLARDVIRERLEVETDPFRRIDLIHFVWQDRSEASLAQLMALAQDETRAPHERLFVADRLTRMGAPLQVAPLLKSLYWDTTDPVLRPGLHCLLWRWYGPPPSQ